MEEWELQPVWLDSSSSSGDGRESNEEDNSSDANSDSPDGEGEMPQSGAPSRPSKNETSTTDTQACGEGTDEGQQQTDEPLHLDSEEGESGAEAGRADVANACFKRFLTIALRYDLVDRSELAPIEDLAQSLLAPRRTVDAKALAGEEG